MIALCIGALICAYTAKEWRGFGAGLAAGFALQVAWYANYIYTLE